ncbi:MAG: hypothetical protein ACOZD0_00940 [Pseudomonadota bacterium]
MPRHRHTEHLPRLLAAGLLAWSGTAFAVDLSWSAFGTIGATLSDRDYTYQRFITDSVGFERDTVFGAQVDAQLAPEWSATLQAKLAPSLRKADRWDLSASWAFVSWRPSNEWLVRVGKLRMPFYLFSENLDVGQSYELARMPMETYAIAPATDTTGLYVTRSWMLGDAELSLDVFSGKARVYHRFYMRDTGEDYKHVNTQLSGAVLTWRADDLTLRTAVLQARSKLGFEPGYTVDWAAAGPGIYLPTGYTDRIVNDIFTLGADWRLGGGWRVLAEFERNIQHKTNLGANTYGGHVAVLKTIDRWTPYVVAAGIQSTGAQRKLRRQLLDAQPPMFIPGLAQGMRMAADGMPFYDQTSLGVGASYALDAHSKIKLEWMHTRIGEGSVMVDSPAGGPSIAHSSVNVLSLSYSFAF